MKCIIYLLLLIFVFKVSSESADYACIAFSGETKECTSIQPTEEISTFLAKNESTKKYANFSSLTLMVCNTKKNIENKTIEEPKIETNKTSEKNLLKILSDETLCGYQQSDDRVHKSEITQFDEFPWLAYINFKNGSLCVGSLIGKRYVLTTATCAENSEAITNVTLGLYNRHKPRSCFGNLCSDFAQTVFIEEVTIHNEYVPNKFKNNVALLRLAKHIYFTDYVRPICLPLGIVEELEINETVMISGWGAINKKDEPVDIKKKLEYKLVNKENCRNVYADEFDDSSLCLKSELEKSTCVGDSGGPLMYNSENQWYAEGLIEFGKCEESSYQAAVGIGTVLEWIVQEVRE